MDDEELIGVLGCALEDCVVEMHELQKQIQILRGVIYTEIKHRKDHSEPYVDHLDIGLERTNKYRAFPLWKYYTYSKQALKLK